MESTPTHPRLDRDVRHGQVLNYEAVRDEANRAVRMSGKSKSEVARELRLQASQVSKATRIAGRTYFNIQLRIIAHLTDYSLEDVGGARVLRKQAPI